MNIAYVLPSLLNRGPNVFTKNLVESLSGKGCNITVYYLDDKVELEFECKTKLIKSFNEIDAGKYQIVHSTMFRPDLYLALHRKKFKSAKIICGIHNYITEDMIFNYGKLKGFLISKIWLSCLNYFDGLVFSSIDMKKYYQDKVNVKCDTVIPYGVPTVDIHEYMTPEFGDLISKLKETHFIIGAVGLLIRRKGFHQLILALKELPGCALVIIGDGDQYKYLKDIAIENNVIDRVIFTGFQKHSKSYYKYFDCYAMTSYSEGFGLAMLDSLSISLPLVCSNLAIYDEYFCSGQVARFELDNINSLVCAFRDVKENKNKYSEGSSEVYSNFFSLDAMGRNHLNYYKEIIANE